MDPSLLDKYDLRVPRYTSYPTAPHFHEGVDRAAYSGWLKAIPPETELSLYAHIPFCHAMCYFCGCFTKIIKRMDLVDEYLDQMCREIDTVAGILGRGRPVRHIHWGGGTPTFLPPDRIRRLTDKLLEHFTLTDDAEFAVEVDPRTVTPDIARALANAGVNRVSMGVQDISPGVQAAINRIQPLEMTQEVVAMMRGLGVGGLNVDIMYGLPRQGIGELLASVDAMIDIRPDRLALFGYAHVPWMRRHQQLINEDELPDGPARLRQFEAAVERFAGHGYEAIGLDHFAHPDDPLSRALHSGALHRNFQGYTTDTATTLIGFGASAIGFPGGGYVQNVASLPQYGKLINEHGLATQRGIALSADDLLRADLIERLMCRMELDVEAVCASHGQDAEALRPALDGLAECQADGLVVRDGFKLTIPPQARPLMRVVCAAFDDYLQPEIKERHSRAV